MRAVRSPRRLTRLADAAGLTLAEITVMLSVLSVVGAVITPAVGDYVNDARLTKAQDDVRTLAMALNRLSFDVDIKPGSVLATSTLMVGPGSVPDVGPGGDAAWTRPSGSESVVELDDHLVSNRAGHTGRSSAGLLRRGWRGPYLDGPVSADPWGRRYAVNLGAADHVVVVLSAGKNGVVETAFSATEPTPGGDDIVALVNAGGL